MDPVIQSLKKRQSSSTFVTGEVVMPKKKKVTYLICQEKKVSGIILFLLVHIKILTETEFRPGLTGMFFLYF